MPRVASNPVAGGGTRSTRQIQATPHKQSPTKLTLNDDRGEKAARMQSRQALQEIQMNEIRAAASPMRKLNQNKNRPRASMEGESPRTTPRNSDAHVPTRKNMKNHRMSINNTGSQNSPRGGNTLLDVVRDTAATPMKRVPILANFEEWIKLATDNKINANNSWNYALIDYFHDMSLLKEGDGVNFQKASCTLDGCVKIYTSRVDSVATETGRLLSGLADGQDGKKQRRGEGEDEEGEEGEEGEDGDEEGDGSKKKKKTRQARSHEATLAASFASLQLKKLELEFAVDPLFKKASADFDEGGAKGLLLNHLSIDSDGRIVFDSSDDVEDAALATDVSQVQEGVEVASQVPQKHEEEEEQDIDLAALGVKFFPDLGRLDAQDICPSMKSFKLGDPASDLAIPFLKAPGDWKEKRPDSPEKPTIGLDIPVADQTGIYMDGSNGFDDDEDGGMLGFDMPDNVGFGEGGEAWAREAAVEQQTRVATADTDGQLDDNLIEGSADGYAVSLQHRYKEDAEHESIMAYFDKAFNSRMKGKNAFLSLENWRIQKIQKAKAAETAPTRRERKEKEPLVIDFVGPMSDSLRELLDALPVNNSTISLPKAQWRTKGRNLLDKDDEVIDTRSLMRLWTKPKCRVGRRKGEMQIIDEGFGARGQISRIEDDDDEGRKGDYDANFFADDDPMLPFDIPLPIDDDEDLEQGEGEQGFMDAREMLSPQPDHPQPEGFLVEDGQDPSQPPPDSQFPSSSQPEAFMPGSFGTQLVTQQGRRLRPEYVNYARTAKKVDVRRLKENMWRGMATTLVSALKFEDQPLQRPVPADDGDVDMMDVDSEPPVEEVKAEAQAPMEPLQGQEQGQGEGGEGELKFTNMIHSLKSVYPEQQMKDISTSYCFICLLHLANEKGLVLEGGRVDGQMGEIMVRRDLSVGEGYVGE